MKKRLTIALAAMLLLACLPFNALAYTAGQEVSINFPKIYLPNDSTNISYIKTGGQVLVSNAPETIHENGAKRADGSEIIGQYNATLSRDTLTGSFRFWASHYNDTTHPLKFWLYVNNISGKEINLYKNIEAYDDAYVTAAASKVTTQFMDTKPKPTLIARIPANEAFYFAYSDGDNVAIHESMVYFAEFNAVIADEGMDANVLVSHVVTTDEVTDPTPYATTQTIARTNATGSRSDDYRGVLQHWGRMGEIEVTLTDSDPFTGIRIADLGYAGEQEPLTTVWDTAGNPVERHEVRFVTPTINKLRLAYWYTDYNIEIKIKNKSRYPMAHTLYGSNGTNPGFVNYSLNGGSAVNYHFSRNTAVPVTTDAKYDLRTMVMPSASLPFSIYFAAGTVEAVPNELAVVKAETTRLQADMDQARTTVNALPAGAEKTGLLQRLELVQAVIAASALTAPAVDATALMLPVVPEGYTVAIKKTKKPKVIALDGTIFPPKEETAVDLILEVTRTADGATAETGIVSVVVPAG